MINNFLPTELETGHGDDLAQWVANIASSDSVVLYSIGDAGYASWSAGVLQQLAKLGIGSNQLNGIQAGEPFIIFGKKGSPAGNAKIFRASQSPVNAQALSVSKTITGHDSHGSLSSVLIGPAQTWSQLRLQLAGATVNDQYGVDVTGVNLDGQQTILKSKLKTTADLSDVNSSLYPYLKLTLYTEDQVDLTPVQLREWLVTYTPMAEGMVTYIGTQQVETRQEGEVWNSTFGFTNFSSINFTDSLVVQVGIFSSDLGAGESQRFKIKPPLPHDTTKFSFQVKTRGKAGANDISVSVNPRILPEQYYDNNVLTLYGHLQVVADRTAPILDVTVDGRRLTNGDAVSAAPAIMAKVIDNNLYLLKTDTIGVNLYLQNPCTSGNCQFKRIAFSSKDVTWTPATTTKAFQVSYQAHDLTAGEYALKVEATDASGNSSGTEPYEVSFVVTDETAFTLQSVYPNPTSDKFHFKIYLTGSLPTDFQFQLYSPTGGMIRSFGNEVLDVLHVGTNEIVLNATDSDGNPLFTGIYFFRMTAVMDGVQTTISGKLAVVR